MYLFFDTETTGIPKNYKAPASDLKNWPRLVQIAWLMTSDTAEQISSTEYIIKPDGYNIPPTAAKVHGITTQKALEVGVDVTTALDAISHEIHAATALVAHNMSFDEKILGSERLRAGRPNTVEAKPRLCTMQSARTHCRIPGPYGYKWPTLQELHKALFKQAFTGAHHALTDVRACAKCYFELKRLHVI